MYLDWQQRVGWGANYQLYAFGRRSVVLFNPDDVRAVTMGRVDPPRDPDMLRHIGSPISPNVIFLVPDPQHGHVRRLMHPFLSGTPTTETVLRVVNDTLWTQKSEAAGVGAAATVGGAAPSYAWLARLEALADSGDSVDLDDLVTEYTLFIMHHLMYSSPPNTADLAETKRFLPRILADVSLLTGVPAPDLLASSTMASIRGAGEYFVRQFQRMEADRRAAYADGSAVAEPPHDMLDILLCDLDKPSGAYKGDHRQVAADMLFYLVAGYDTTVRNA